MHRVLVRLGLNRLRDLDRPTGKPMRARRYERERPGELIHVDVKKLGKIRPGGGWRVHGRGSAQANAARRLGMPRRRSLPFALGTIFSRTDTGVKRRALTCSRSSARNRPAAVPIERGVTPSIPAERAPLFRCRPGAVARRR